MTAQSPVMGFCGAPGSWRGGVRHCRPLSAIYPEWLPKAPPGLGQTSWESEWDSEDGGAPLDGARQIAGHRPAAERPKGGAAVFFHPEGEPKVQSVNSGRCFCDWVERFKTVAQARWLSRFRQY